MEGLLLLAAGCDGGGGYISCSTQGAQSPRSRDKARKRSLVFEVEVEPTSRGTTIRLMGSAG